MISSKSGRYGLADVVNEAAYAGQVTYLTQPWGLYWRALSLKLRWPATGDASRTTLPQRTPRGRNCTLIRGPVA
jgi:hypothetical protein